MPTNYTNMKLIQELRDSGMSLSDLSEECAKSGFNISLADINQFCSGWSRPTDEQRQVIDRAISRFRQDHRPKALDQMGDAHRQREARRQFPLKLRELRQKGFSFLEIAEMMGLGENAVATLEKASVGEAVPQEFVDRFWSCFINWAAHQE